MPTSKLSKWMQHTRRVKEDMAHESRQEFWNSLSLPKRKKTNRKPKPKGSHNKIKERLKSLAYKQTEERDEGYCVVCGATAQSHHHIIKQSTRYGPQYIQRMENIVLVCTTCHVEIHNPKGKSLKQAYLEELQQRYYPEYVETMRELAKVTGCRDEELIQRWNIKQEVALNETRLQRLLIQV